MKVLTTKEDVVAIKLKSGKTVLVKEQEFVVLAGKKPYKVGYDDAILMNKTIKSIMANVFEERDKLRRLESLQREELETLTSPKKA